MEVRVRLIGRSNPTPPCGCVQAPDGALCDPCHNAACPLHGIFRWFVREDPGRL